MQLRMDVLGLVRRGRSASTSVVNAWQGMADDAKARAERQRLAAGNHHIGPGNWLDLVTVDDCWRLLESAELGRVGFTAHSGYPVVLPVNYSVVDRRIVIRTGRGPKLEAARRGDLVAFEVDEIDLHRHIGWSVTVTGRARWVRDTSELAALEAKAPSAWVAGSRTEIVVINPVNVAGRRLSEPIPLDGEA